MTNYSKARLKKLTRPADSEVKKSSRAFCAYFLAFLHQKMYGNVSIFVVILHVFWLPDTSLNFMKFVF